MKSVWIAVVSFLTCGVAAAPVDANPSLEGRGAVAFGWIKGLVGQWEGTVEWSGARSDKGQMGATYQQAGNGSAVVETLSIASEPLMTSVYHLDGPDLRMTHYCAAGNQPRFRGRLD